MTSFSLHWDTKLEVLLSLFLLPMIMSMVLGSSILLAWVVLFIGVDLTRQPLPFLASLLKQSYSCLNINEELDHNMAPYSLVD